MHSASETDFRFEYITNAGQNRLREKCLANCQLQPAAQASQNLCVVILRGKHRRAKLVEDAPPPQRFARGELRDRHREPPRLKLRSSCHDPHVPRGPLPALGTTVNVPAAVHQHVRQQNQVAGKINQQPFAASFDLLHHSARHSGVHFHALEFRQDALESCNSFASKCAIERARRAKNRISLRHYALSEISRSLPSSSAELSASSPGSIGVTRAATRLIWNPSAVSTKPASVSTRARKCSRAGASLISPISNPLRRPCQRTASSASFFASSLAICIRSGSLSGRNTRIAGLRRRRNAASAPFTRITPAPLVRDIVW